MISVNGQRRGGDPIGDLAADLADLDGVARIVVNRGDLGRDWLDVVNTQTAGSHIHDRVADHGCEITVVSSEANPRHLTITEDTQ